MRIHSATYDRPMRIPSVFGIKNFIKLLLRHKFTIPKIWVLLGVSRFRVLFTPFSTIAKKIGHFQQETPSNPVPENELLVSIGSLIRYVSRFTPWKSNCFAQALCAHHILKSKKIDHTIYFGVQMNETMEMKAHAWLRAGSLIVTGASGRQAFTVTGKFAFYIENNSSVH
ncbi:hypothetical protein GCM10028791_42400 [Echinicola sediminis]